jgi:hypothetical protein
MRRTLPFTAVRKGCAAGGTNAIKPKARVRPSGAKMYNQLGEDDSFDLAKIAVSSEKDKARLIKIINQARLSKELLLTRQINLALFIRKRYNPSLTA